MTWIPFTYEAICHYWLEEINASKTSAGSDQWDFG